MSKLVSKLVKEAAPLRRSALSVGAKPATMSSIADISRLAKAIFHETNGNDRLLMNPNVSRLASQANLALQKLLTAIEES